MPKVYYVQNNFTRGEISPRLTARIDLDQYKNGCKSVINMTPLPHGGITRRGGTNFVETAAGECRLIPFEYSTTQAYILEFSNNLIRVYKDQAIVENAGSPIEIVTTYTTAELDDIQFCQSADTLYIVHPSHAPATLTRSSHISWTLANITFTAKPAEWTGTNYPSCVTFFEQRLVFSATPAEPQTIWMSKSADYTNMTTGTADDDALVYTIATDQVNKIQWMVASKALICGTAGGEFVVSASSITEGITPTNVRIVRESTYGSSYDLPVMVGNIILFTQKAKRKIRELAYQFDQDSWVAPDMTLLSEHITVGGISKLSYQQEPDSIIWSIRNDGTLLGLTYKREENVVAWHRHIIGGTSDSGGTQAQVESIASIPSTDGSRDELWLSVKRYVDGSTVRHVEVLTAGLGEEDDIEDAFFVDSGLTYDSTATTSISGLDHLEGETVTILADGAVQTDKVVASGAITLDKAASVVHVGYNFNSDIETLSIEAGSVDGPALGKIKRINEVGVKLYKTVGCTIGKDTSNLDRIPFRDSSMNMDEAVPLYTGDKFSLFDAGFLRSNSVYIRQNQPLPMTILAIMVRVKTNN